MVNLAARMEGQGMAGEIRLTEATYRRIDVEYDCIRRGVITVKGQGDMQLDLLRGKEQTAPPA